MGNSVLKILIKKVIEFIFFIFVLIMLNIAINYVSIPIFEESVKFLNSNVLFLGLIALIMFLGEACSILKFPFNLPSPLFNSIGALFMILFIFEFFGLLIEQSQVKIDLPLDMIFFIISVLVIAVILLTGYYHIFRDFLNQPKKVRRQNENTAVQEEKPIKKTRKYKVKKKKKIKIE
jgi:hypothetical protein